MKNDYLSQLEEIWKRHKENVFPEKFSNLYPLRVTDSEDKELNNYVMPEGTNPNNSISSDLWGIFGEEENSKARKTGPVILFLGLNPSAVSTVFNSALQHEKIHAPNSSCYGKANITLGEVWDINYFQTIRKLMHYIFPGNEEAYAYADLFQMRVTTKDAVEWAVKNHTRHTVLTNFLDGQLKITTNLIQLINPDIIVVNNALASKYVLTGLNGLTNPLSGISTALNSKCGTHIWNNNGKDVPVFCTRMMSGGGLDDQSIERLAWHIRNVFRMNSNQLPSTFN